MQNKEKIHLLWIIPIIGIKFPCKVYRTYASLHHRLVNNAMVSTKTKTTPRFFQSDISISSLPEGHLGYLWEDTVIIMFQGALSKGIVSL